MNRPRRRLIIADATVVEVAGLWLRSRRLAGNVIVRCRDGHLSTTIP